MDANGRIYNATITGIERVENHRNAKKSRRATVAAAAVIAAAADTSLQQQRSNLHVNFDHLSIVSEEEPSTAGGGGGYCDLLDGDDEVYYGSDRAAAVQSDQMFSSLNDFQSIVPPLAHFENLCYEQIGPNLGKFYLFSFSGQYMIGFYIKDAYGQVLYPPANMNNDVIIMPVSKQHQLLPPPPLLTTNYPVYANKFHGPADICVQNVIAHSEPIYAKIEKISSRTCSPSAFPVS